MIYVGTSFDNFVIIRKFALGFCRFSVYIYCNDLLVNFVFGVDYSTFPLNRLRKSIFFLQIVGMIDCFVNGFGVLNTRSGRNGSRSADGIVYIFAFFAVRLISVNRFILFVNLLLFALSNGLSLLVFVCAGFRVL